MRNRALLGVVAVIGIVVAGVGVATVVFPALSGPPSVSTVSDPPLDWRIGGPYEGNKTDPVGGVRVGDGAGDGAGGLPILIWNDAAVNRTVAVRLVHNATGTTVVDRRVAVPANGTFLVRILAADGYLLTVGGESLDESGSYPVSTEHFDCNERLVTVRVRASGSVESRAIQTDMGCGWP